MAIEAVQGVMGVQTSSAIQKPAPKAEPNIAPISENFEKVGAPVQAAQNRSDSGKYSEQSQEQAKNEQIRKAVETLNKNMANSEAVFGIHEDTNRVTIKIVDSTTKEVIKELPPEKTLDMIARVWELAGILVDEKR